MGRIQGDPSGRSEWASAWRPGRARAAPTRLFVVAVVSVAAVATLPSCSDEAKPKEMAVAVFPEAGAGDTGAAAAPYVLTSMSKCGSGGFQTVAAAAGAKVAFATLAGTESTSSCTTLNGTAEVSVYDICYAESSGGDFAAAIVTSQPYLALTGVGLALTSTGQAQIAFTGGPPAELRCGASDLQLVTGTSAGFGAARTLATGSAGSVVPDQAGNCVQDVCNSGDATGFWPAIAVDRSGRSGVAFRDIHFGFASDDFASSDVEFAHGDAYAATTIDVARGGGTYLRLAYGADGNAAVVHYSADRDPAIWLNRESAQGWSSKKLVSAKIGEQLGFGIGPSGLFSLAYYDDAKSRLQYMESSDGAQWTEPTSPDLAPGTGLYPSLAFDADGDPAIAYYRCSDRAAAANGCDAEKDGLLLARRKGGAWSTREIVKRAGGFEGLYPALAFAGSKAVIGHQARAYDAISATSTTTFWIAEEP